MTVVDQTPTVAHEQPLPSQGPDSVDGHRQVNVKGTVVAWRIIGRVALGVLIVESAWVAGELVFGFDRQRWGIAGDYVLYRDAAASWLNGKGFYHAYQIAGPYSMWQHPLPIMYPPVALWLLVPFVFLPAALWWAIPLGVVAWSLWRLRPAPWAWVAIVVLALIPSAPQEIIDGNPGIWAWAACSLAVLVGWPGPLILFKPSLAPFAIVGIRRRSWWLVLILGIAASLPFGAMWGEYVTVSRNIIAPWTYLLNDVPLLAIPVVAWLGSQVRDQSQRSWATCA